ncbi:hypothetical protein RRF57_012871 [Xylaria bambusicola]|uniref:Uncharacterized protein n=1 Tax=Xylaria bambusicola TaxID=326684 RepID=A0AAN7V621_9PEZI
MPVFINNYARLKVAQRFLRRPFSILNLVQRNMDHHSPYRERMRDFKQNTRSANFVSQTTAQSDIDKLTCTPNALPSPLFTVPPPIRKRSIRLTPRLRERHLPYNNGQQAPQAPRHRRAWMRVPEYLRD